MDVADENFIQQNSPDSALNRTVQGKDFLQSDEWRKFQESVGRKAHNIQDEGFWANIIEHTLPAVGKYFYIPQGPVVSEQETANSEQNIKQLIDLAKENSAGWIRVEPNSSEDLELIKNAVGKAHVHSENRNAYMRSLQNYKIVKAPHDMQPKELFIIDITRSEEQLIAEMKAKTRYNIKIAEKRGVVVKISNSPNCLISNKITNDKLQISNKPQISNDQNSKNIDEFIRLTAIMAKRQGIAAHPENYYRKMLEVIPGDILKLYVAEYQGKVICANLVIFYGNTATYLHGASDDEYRNVMAPFLLQWRQILDAKAAGCERYDFGGISTNYESSTNVRITNKWSGISRFKLGFSPDTKPTEFPGCYDIIIDQKKYFLYKIMSRITPVLKLMKIV